MLTKIALKTMSFMYSQVTIMVLLQVKMILNKTSENKPYGGPSLGVILVWKESTEFFIIIFQYKTSKNYVSQLYNSVD